jgi:hypothetical protein
LGSVPAFFSSASVLILLNFGMGEKQLRRAIAGIQSEARTDHPGGRIEFELSGIEGEAGTGVKTGFQVGLRVASVQNVSWTDEFSRGLSPGLHVQAKEKEKGKQ